MKITTTTTTTIKIKIKITEKVIRISNLFEIAILINIEAVYANHINCTHTNTVRTLNDFPTLSSSDSKSKKVSGKRPHNGRSPHSTLLRTDRTPV